jgi:hypothetical protein
MQRLLLWAGICCVLLPGLAAPGDVPQIKTGLWKTVTTSGDPNIPEQTGTMCTSTALLQTLFDQQKKDAARPCKQTSIVHAGSTITEQTECKFGGTLVKNTAVTVLTGDTEVRTQIHREGKSSVTVSDSKYVGACPAGMKVGDFLGADGTKFNVLQPEKLKDPAKSP